MRRTPILLALGLTAALAAAPLAVPASAPPARAAEAADLWSPGFYDTPAELPGTAGQLVRSERMTYLLDPEDVGSLTVTAHRLMYTSTDSHGRVVPVTGMVLVPRMAWGGKGERPVIALAEGTKGLVDACAPSRTQAQHTNYEATGIQNLLTAGYAVAVTDYQGLGTQGEHTPWPARRRGTRCWTWPGP